MKRLFTLVLSCLLTCSPVLADGMSTGSAGAQGPQGVQGPQGPQGPQGAQGPQGEAGSNGSDGARGLQGVQGDKGDKGDNGDAGPRGLQGVQGEQGLQGAKGDGGSVSINNNTPATSATVHINIPSQPFAQASGIPQPLPPKECLSYDKSTPFMFDWSSVAGSFMDVSTDYHGGVVAADKRLWITEPSNNTGHGKLYAYTSGGVRTAYSTTSQAWTICNTSDGRVATVGQYSDGTVNVYDLDGTEHIILTATALPGITSMAGPGSQRWINTGRDGRLWVTNNSSDPTKGLFAVTLAGVQTLYPTTYQLGNACVGSDGRLFALCNVIHLDDWKWGIVAAYDTSGTETLYDLSATLSALGIGTASNWASICSGADGNLYLTIERYVIVIDTSGTVIRSFHLTDLTYGGWPGSNLIAGPDGKVHVIVISGGDTSTILMSIDASGKYTKLNLTDTIAHVSPVATYLTNLYLSPGGDILYFGSTSTCPNVFCLAAVPAASTFPHNSYSRIQGGTTGEAYHLTSAEHTSVLTAGATPGNYVNPDSITIGDLGKVTAVAQNFRKVSEVYPVSYGAKTGWQSTPAGSPQIDGQWNINSYTWPTVAGEHVLSMVSDPNCKVGHSMWQFSPNGAVRGDFWLAKYNVTADGMVMIGFSDQSDYFDAFIKKLAIGNAPNATPSNYAAFRYMPSTYTNPPYGFNYDGDTCWHFVTGCADDAIDGSAYPNTDTAITSAVPQATPTVLTKFSIVFSATDVKAYINDVLVATHTTHIPNQTAALRYAAQLNAVSDTTSLSNGLVIGKMRVTSN